MLFLKEFFLKINFEKISRRQKHEKFPISKELNAIADKSNGTRGLNFVLSFHLVHSSVVYASMIVLAQFSYSQPKNKYMLHANIIKIGL